LYSDAQIYLFDDPLSAVDANVAKNLFENCFEKYLKSKIRILVTHQVHFLTNVNQIIYLANGEMKIQGCFSDLIKTGINMEMMANSESKEVEKVELNSSIANNIEEIIKSENKINQSIELLAAISSNQFLDATTSSLNIVKSNLKLDTPIENNQLDEEETKQSGILSWKNYFVYFKVGGGLFGCILNFVIFTSAQVLVVLADYWVSNWSSLEDIDMLNKLKLISNSSYCSNCTVEIDHINVQTELFKNRYYYYKIYCILIVSALIIGTLRTVIFYKLCINSSKYLHKAMFQSVMFTKIRFFDLNPLGRIMNRFSKDIGVIDETIPMTVFDVKFILSFILYYL
jgi:ATP-binding cassette subfamily C (CFTR/MRP) protein 4